MKNLTEDADVGNKEQKKEISNVADGDQSDVVQGAAQETAGAVAGVTKRLESPEQIDQRLNEQGLALLKANDARGFNGLRHKHSNWIPDFTGCDLTGAKLVEAYLSGCDLTGAKLVAADLSEADLSGADLNGADLSGADLNGADLSGADLSGADLYEADLTEACFIETDLTDIKGLTPEMLSVTLFLAATVDPKLAQKTLKLIAKSTTAPVK